LLGAAVELPDGEGVLFTGRLSLSTHPWLAEHAVKGTVIVPGAALVEIAVRAGDQIGCGTVRDLTLHAPLVVAADRAVDLRVRVGQGDEPALTVHSRGEGEDWTLHAEGSLTAEAVEPADLGSAWPPAGAEQVEATTLYADLAALGLEYGTLFQGVAGVWRDGDDTVYAEVALPEGTDTDGYGIHPALLDASLHAISLLTDEDDGTAQLPFSWTDFALHAAGASALRLRIGRSGSAYRIDAVDAAGAPVATVGSLALRPLAVESGTVRDLYRIDWTPLAAQPTEPTTSYTILQAATATELLPLLQAHLNDEQPLLVHTRQAATDPDQAAIRGLVRAAQAEHPDRIVLLDTTGDLPDHIPTGEPELAHTDDRFTAPRLARETVVAEGSWSASGTVLITGGTGGLGALTARHLVSAHGVRSLL
ncbi:polyketide synthase dehydratase domain-containing protein, partial [Streptomyces sp. NPDC047028]|uniref:polyketide synthase dehydratase domain-containing protein n=1 Tax=Streptomyces sp. NPDC047028 TaxID=3155793 RepID=UPI0033E5686F